MARQIGRWLGWLLLGAAALVATGCAAGTTRLQVNHDPLATVADQRQGNILVKPFVDAREQTEYIGNKRNGFGMVLGHVATHEGVQVDQLLTGYFLEALKDAGYNAVLDLSGSGGAPPAGSFDAILEGQIETFWMDLYMMVWHQVGVRVKALHPQDQRVLWEKLIEGSEKRTLWVGATGEYERIVREALTKALNRAAEEFASEEFYQSAIRHRPL